MKQNINIEAEGNELILKNKAGDYVIIPKKYRTEVQDMIKEGCHCCIDNLVETLPVMEDYAEDGSLLPSWDEVKSVYDKWDLEPVDFGKPFEIYDRIYVKDYGDGQKKRMYYSDKELSELDIDKKNFDTLALQIELSNRDYKLPKSTKKDGSFDGVWGDETKNALIDWQNKNKTN